MLANHDLQWFNRLTRPPKGFTLQTTMDTQHIVIYSDIEHT
jgi:hypothetical protein